MDKYGGRNVYRDRKDKRLGGECPGCIIYVNCERNNLKRRKMENKASNLFLYL